MALPLLSHADPALGLGCMDPVHLHLWIRQRLQSTEEGADLCCLSNRSEHAHEQGRCAKQQAQPRACALYWLGGEDKAKDNLFNPGLEASTTPTPTLKSKSQGSQPQPPARSQPHHTPGISCLVLAHGACRLIYQWGLLLLPGSAS